MVLTKKQICRRQCVVLELVPLVGGGGEIQAAPTRHTCVISTIASQRFSKYPTSIPVPCTREFPRGIDIDIYIYIYRHSNFFLDILTWCFILHTMGNIPRNAGKNPHESRRNPRENVSERHETCEIYKIQTILHELGVIRTFKCFLSQAKAVPTI